MKRLYQDLNKKSLNKFNPFIEAFFWCTFAENYRTAILQMSDYSQYSPASFKG
jgi:hypothetical protein